MYDEHFERLAEWATGERFAAELASARTEFFDATGPVHEEDRSFEMRMSALSEFYLFDRPLTFDGEGRSPVRLFLDEHAESLTTADRSIYRGLTRTRAGLFEIRRLRETNVRVRDLISREDIEVLERRRLAGLEKGDVVQTRLVPYNEHLLFGRAFLYHPRTARRLITKRVKTRRKAGELEDDSGRKALLWALSRTALLHERQAANNRTPPPVERIYGVL